MRPAKTQISLGIRPVWSDSSLCAQWVAKDTSFLHSDSEDSDQTGLMPRLIWVFAVRTCHFVGFVVLRLIRMEFQWPFWPTVCIKWLKMDYSNIYYEPQHDKANKMICASTKDPDHAQADMSLRWAQSSLVCFVVLRLISRRQNSVVKPEEYGFIKLLKCIYSTHSFVANKHIRQSVIFFLHVESALFMTYGVKVIPGQAKFLWPDKTSGIFN